MDKDIKKIESRRKFIKTAGRFAVFVPPALMVMTKPGQANFTKTCGGQVCDHQYPD